MIASCWSLRTRASPATKSRARRHAPCAAATCWTSAESSAARGATASLRHAAIETAQHFENPLAEIGQVVGAAAAYEVPIDHNAGVFKNPAGVDQVVLDA